jgi:TolB-like protein/DNA-binding winged helix-turn-helix (wHTH) protein/Flp pilus assembly protein TadD
MSVRFGEYEFDRSARELRSRGRAVRLQEQPFLVLDLLLENAGAVVSREALHQRLWPTKVYYDRDHGLNNAITRLREVLHDSADRPRYIETIPKLGYRFVAPIEAPVIEPEPEPDPIPGPSVPGSEPVEALATSSVRVGWRGARLALLVAVTLCIAAGAVLGTWRLAHPRTAIRSIAVLPFENLSSDPGQDYFVDGITDAVITDLARLNALNVISRTSVMRFRGVREPVSKIAQELGVDAIVEGSVVRAGEHVRVNAHLVRATDDHQLWAQSYDQELVSAIALEGELSEAVAEAVALTLSPVERARIVHAHIPPAQAYDDYLRGMHLVNQVTRDSELASIPYFQSAIAADAQFAAAYAGLSQAYSLLGGATIGFGLRADVALPRAADSARKAIALDPQLVEGWTALAVALDKSGNQPSIEALRKNAAERAVALGPGDAWAHKVYAEFLLDNHDPTASLREFERSVRLDPLNPRINSSYAEALMVTGRIDEGISRLQAAVALDPWALVSRVKLGFDYITYGQRYEEALTEFRAAHQISADSLPVQTGLVIATALSGRTQESEALLRAMIPLAQALGRPSAVAVGQLALHHRDEARAWLERSLEERDDSFFKEDRAPFLIADPDYQRYIRKIRELPPAQPVAENVTSTN